MKRKRNYTETERALIAIGVIANIPLTEIDAALHKSQDKVGASHRSLHPVSHGMLKAIYIPIMADLSESGDNNETRAKFFRYLWDHCISPQSVDKLCKAKTESAAPLE